jgi:micrococcal nuclease
MIKITYLRLFLLSVLLFGCKRTKQGVDDFTGKVVGVKDGDTIVILADNTTYTVRLAEVDCPEKAQPYGNKARQFTAYLCFSKPVRVVSSGKDKYGRVIGTVFIDDTNLNKELIIAGLAWHYKAYSNNSVYANLEELARHDRVGLWADDHPTPPWEFRKIKRPATQGRLRPAVRHKHRTKTFTFINYLQ